MTICEDIDAKRDLLRALRKSKPKGAAELDRWYGLELTYTSNAIEGNTLTRAETALVVDKGTAIEGKPLRDHLEAQDHDAALILAHEIADGGSPLGEETMRKLHEAALKRSQPEEAGFYSRHQRRIRGSYAVLPSPVKIPAMMEAVGGWLANAPPTAETAIEGHWRLVAIHPFSDGNGRAARLLMNLILRRGGYAPLVIAPEHRKAYLDALEKRQKDGDDGPYKDFMAARLIASFDDQIRGLEESEEGSVG